MRLEERFAASVERFSSRIAVQCGEASWTYRELDHHANGIAAGLAAAGVLPGDAVGLLMRRSSRMIAAILGIYKIGAHYVALDTAYPEARLRYVCNDSGVATLLVDEPTKLSEALSRNTLCVAELLGAGDEPTLVPQLANGAAYVLYTSGSTGQPRGAAISHSHVDALLEHAQSLFAFDEHDVWTQVHSHAFDFSVWEIWGALAFGGRLVILPAEVTRDPATMCTALLESGTTVLNQTPAAFRSIVDHAVQSQLRFPALSVVIFGGDVLDANSVRRWFEYVGEEHPRLVNMYGITETTVHVTFCPLSAEFLDQERRTPIGDALPHLSVHLFDEHMNAVPEGTTGEIYVGGASVGWGYVGRAALTAQRFVPDPFSSSGGRLYRSGDLSVMDANGCLRFSGRGDDQVKIRGHRIELREVEIALLACDGIDQVAVCAIQDDAGNSLTAYLVGKAGSPVPDITQLRRYLLQRIPDYMIPARFELLDVLPLTQNGKIDRSALAASRGRSLLLEDAYEAPRSPTEQVLAQVLIEVLKVPQVGVNDNYFAIGGDSIRSIVVREKASKQGVVFAVGDLFLYSTVRELAAAIDAGLTSATERSTPTQPFELIDAQTRAQLPADVEDAYPLSHTQVGMLFHSEYGRDHATYHDIIVHTLRLRFDEGALRATLEALSVRHAILRTGFELTGYEQPLQMVYRQARARCEVADLRAVEEIQQRERVSQWIEAEKARGFNWREAPLLRVGALVTGDERFVLGFSFHHAILDGWSVASLTNEFTRVYEAQLRDEAVQLEALPTSFREYIALERAASEDEQQRAFWLQQLQEAALVRLPRSAQGGRGIERVEVSMEALGQRLKRLAAQLEVPVRTLLLVGHLRALSALSGQRDVISGVVLNGRAEVEAGEAVLGLFLNTVPMRVRMETGRSWRELIAQVFALERQVWSHRRYPMPLMQREQGGTTLFECIFNYTHFHNYAESLRDEAAVISDRGGFEHSNYPLVVQALRMPATGELRIILEGNRELYAPTHVEQMAQVYASVLEAMAEDVGSRHDARSYISEATREKLLTHWNATEQSYPIERLDELFYAQVQRTPQAIAIEDDREQLTYRQLDERSEVIARQLSALGVSAGTRVGVSMDRSVGLIEVILAIVKAGGAYVPLDRSYPGERLLYLSTDAGVSVVVSEEHAPWSDAQVNNVQYVAGELHGEGNKLPERGLRGSRTGSSSAYVMYTSGSTGEPKGVVVSDRGIVRLVRQSNYLSIGEQDVLLQLAPVSFDASTLEIWGALLNGARLVMAPRGRVALSEIGELIQRHQVSVLWLTAPLFHLMVDEGLEGLRGVRSLLAGGDALSVTHVQKYLSQPWAGELINGYGPTEATTFSCCHVMKQWQSEWSSVPIGTPISNSTAYVLDEHLQLVPIGTPGELYVGGAGVAQGYWGRARLTAERFVPDEYANRPGARLYRTGDRVRYLADGRLEFMGRMDEQLKVRGYRIEPGEIEQVLRQHEGVRDTAVVAREVNEATKQLVAYVVGEVSGAQLQSYLRERLPEYLVPSVYVQLGQLPLTVNGKVDREALPAPQVEVSEGTAYSPPQGATEEALSQIWSEVLGVAQVGRDDNFFELGGDSILSIQIKARAQESGIHFSLEHIFDLQTIARIAECAELGLLDETATVKQVEPFELISEEDRLALAAED